MIDLLRRPEGATIEEITAATEWQSDTVRGACPRSRKTCLEITSEKVEERDASTVSD